MTGTWVHIFPIVCGHTMPMLYSYPLPSHLLVAVNEDSIQDEVCPEQRPLTLDVLKQLQLRRLVVEPVRVLERG